VRLMSSEGGPPRPRSTTRHGPQTIRPLRKWLVWRSEGNWLAWRTLDRLLNRIGFPGLPGASVCQPKECRCVVSGRYFDALPFARISSRAAMPCAGARGVRPMRKAPFAYAEVGCLRANQFH